MLPIPASRKRASNETAGAMAAVPDLPESEPVASEPGSLAAAARSFFDTLNRLTGSAQRFPVRCLKAML